VGSFCFCDFITGVFPGQAEEIETSEVLAKVIKAVIPEKVIGNPFFSYLKRLDPQ